MKDLEQAVHVIRALVEGRAIEFEGTMLELPWTSGHQLPVWIAGYGPVALKLTGRIADGAMLQIGDPDLVRWFVSQVRDSAARGRPRPEPRPGHGRGAAHVGDLADGRDRTRWFPALVGNHVALTSGPSHMVPEGPDARRGAAYAPPIRRRGRLRRWPPPVRAA